MNGPDIIGSMIQSYGTSLFSLTELIAFFVAKTQFAMDSSTMEMKWRIQISRKTRLYARIPVARTMGWGRERNYYLKMSPHYLSALFTS